jgi:hypothetical protein
MRLAPPTATDCSFEAFSRAVRKHFASPSSTLPVRDPSLEFVDRASTVIYSDPACQQLLVVYSPTTATMEPAAGKAGGASARLEFIQLTLAQA